MKKVFLSAVITIATMWVNVAHAQGGLSPQQVQQKAIEATRIAGMETESSMTIYSPSGDKRVRKMTIVSKLYENGSLEKKLIRFTEPADVKGTGFLSFDYLKKNDDKWIYMPALRKTRRIVSSENAKSFMGSEFSYADMSTPAVEDFNYKFLKDQNVGNHVCYVLEITPKNKTIANENGFSKKIAYIDKHIFIIHKATYYNLAGEKEKEMTVSAITEVDTKHHKYRFKEMTMINLKNERKSVLNNNVIKFTPSISDSYFTTRTLEQGK